MINEIVRNYPLKDKEVFRLELLILCTQAEKEEIEKRIND